MSEVVQGRTPASGHLSFSQIAGTIIAALILSTIGGALSVWVSQARTSDRIDAVERAQEKTVTRELLEERWKTVERIDQNVEKIRDKLLQEQKRGRER
jgi:Na+-translocating ferredoxin:NAD+ oxidoreductase RnfG subunit